MDTLGVWAGTDRDPRAARRHAGRAADEPGPVDDPAFDARFGDQRPLGLWRAAGLHAGRFRQLRLVSLLVLLTPTRRVEREHAVATVVVRDGVSLVVWVVIWVLSVAILTPATLLGALEVSPLLWLVVPVAVGALIVASSAVGQRVDVWWRWRGQRGALAIGNVAASPEGRGFAGALMDELASFADAAGRAMVLRVDAHNERAIRLHRRHGFEPLDEAQSSRVRMMRSPTMGPRSLSLAIAPSWLAPIPVTVPAVAVGAVLGAGLTALYWATPAAWLMLPLGLVGGIAADCDLRWLRIPNRLLGVGALLNLALIVIVGLLCGVAMLGPAVVGAAVAAGPLFGQHVATAGRSPGLADAKLAAVLGLIAGAVHPAAAISGLLLAMLLGALFGLIWRWRGAGGQGFPLGPALVMGVVLVLAMWRLLEGQTTW